MMNRICSCFRRFSASHSGFFKLSNEVGDALQSGSSIVALESTVITHGMPWPQNFQNAKTLEEIIRSNGCMPATIAVVDGQICAGLATDELELLASSTKCRKLAKRDLSYAVAKGLSGGTTVSATAYIANKLGISVFATGGVGGVHRDVGDTWDISSDLKVLGNTPIAVVCAGVKSILDIGKTLEYLETEGVTVATVGSSTKFPGFFTADSGYDSHCNVSNIEEAVKLIESHREMDMTSGILFAVPIQDHMEESAGKEINEAVKKALEEARSEAITGSSVTPFVLKRVNELTEGKSLDLNISLIKQNTEVAAKIARLLSERRAAKVTRTSSVSGCSNKTSPSVVTIGSSNADVYISSDKEIIPNGQTYPGTVTLSCGGVGRNMADALTQLGVQTSLVSAVGQDSLGDYLLHNCKHMDTTSIRQDRQAPTAAYGAVVDHKSNLSFGVFCPGQSQTISPSDVQRAAEKISHSNLVVMDGNIRIDTMKEVCSLARRNNIPVWFDPTDVRHLSKVFEADAWDAVRYISPNWAEFLEILKQLGLSLKNDVDLANLSTENITNLYHQLLDQNRLTIRAVMGDNLKALLLTLGSHGVIVVRKEEHKYEAAFYESPHSWITVVNPSGAGDCLNAGVIHGILQGESWDACISRGYHAVLQTLTSWQTVPSSLRPLELVKPTIPSFVMDI